MTNTYWIQTRHIGVCNRKIVSILRGGKTSLGMDKKCHVSILCKSEITNKMKNERIGVSKDVHSKNIRQQETRATKKNFRKSCTAFKIIENSHLRLEDRHNEGEINFTYLMR